MTVAQRLRIVVIGLPELGHLLEVAEPHGADVVTIPLGSDVGAILADKARGATRATLLFVVADCGDPAVNALPDTLARAGFRGLVLAGLPGASGTFAPHDNLHVLPAPFNANDVLASLSALPDVPFFLPVAGGDRTFGDLAPVAASRPSAVPVPAASTSASTSTATGGRRERNGILFPRRERPDDDPLGPPVRVLPLDPLPAPPPPPPAPQAEVTPIFAIAPGANPVTADPPTPPTTPPVALAPEPSAPAPMPPATSPEPLPPEPPPAPVQPAAPPVVSPEPAVSVTEPPPPSPASPVGSPEPDVSTTGPPPAPVLPAAPPEPEPDASVTEPPPPAPVPPVGSPEPDVSMTDPPPAPVPPVASPVVSPEPEPEPDALVSEPPPPAPVPPVGSPEPDVSMTEPTPALVLPVVSPEPEPEPDASLTEPPPPAPVSPVGSPDPDVSMTEPPPAPVLPVASREPEPEPDASVSEPPPPAPVSPVGSPDPDVSMSEPPPAPVLAVASPVVSPVVLPEPEPEPDVSMTGPPPAPVLPVAAPVVLPEPEPSPELSVSEPPRPASTLPESELGVSMSEPPRAPMLPVASQAESPEPELSVSDLPPAAPVFPVASPVALPEPEPEPVSVSKPRPAAPMSPVGSPEPEVREVLEREPVPPAPVLPVASAPGPPEPVVVAEPPPVDPLGSLDGADGADGADGMPGWAQLPAAPVGVERAEGAWARSAPVAGALWVATPRLPAYQDEPVMPGARLPAPQSLRGQRRGEVVSVCSYKGGSGKCLTGDSMITDPVSGVPRRLDEIVRDPAATTVLTLDGDQVTPVPIAAKIDSGVQPTVRVEFASGRSVTVTPHHPFLLADGWRPAERIAVGEEAALPGSIPFPVEPRRLPATEIARLAARLSDHGCRRPAPGDGDTGAAAAGAEAVYRLPEDQLGHFLALLWTADGTVGHDGTPSLELAAEASVRMVQHLLLRFGVQSRLSPAAGAQGCRLDVGPGDRATFARHIPLCGRQRDRLMELAAADPEPCREGDVAWDRVTAIRPAGTQQVWDLTVDGTHCFVANDIVVHNTTTAVLAAATLARAVRPGGKRVALVDANTAQSSVATILQRPARGSILDLVRTDVDEDMLALALTPIPEAGDLDVLFGAPDLRCADERLLTPTLWRRVVAALRRTHDYVIVDTPVAEAVGHELFDDFVLRDSSLLLVVLDPNRETIHNNVEWLDIIGDPVSAGGRNFPPDRVAIVLNRADPQLAWNEHSVGDHFRRYHYLGAIPHSTAVQQAADDARLTQRFDATVDQAVRHMLGALLHEPLLDEDAAQRTTGSALDRLLERLFRRGSRAECSPV